MKLTFKFTVAMILLIVAVLSVNAWQRIEREVGLFEAGMRRHAHTLGRALGHAVAFTWQTRGEEDALKLVADASEQYSDVDLRWVWLDDNSPEPYRARLGVEDLARLRSGREVARRLPTQAGPGALYTYFPVSLRDGRMGALEIAESLRTQSEVVDSIWHHVFTAALILTVTIALFVTALGAIFVGRPTRALVLQARRIGAGDLGSPLVLKQHDELGEIAKEMNEMCSLLLATREQVAAETAARIEAMEQLRHADRLMTIGKLAAGIAHELGTPLNVVSGRAQMIASGESREEEVAESARVIVSLAKRMADIIRQLLAFGRPRKVKLSTVDLTKMTQQTLELLTPMAKKRNVNVIFTPTPLPAATNADEGQLQQVLTNLVVNGLQATQAGGTVTVEVRDEIVQPPLEHGGGLGSYLRMSVTDTGIGMDAETLARVFEPFFTTKDVGEGTGLGLAVAHGIVKEHGGWIVVRSEKGRSTTFSVYLPAAVSHT